MIPLSIFTVSAAISALVVGGLLRSGLAWKIAMDRPNERSLHVRPIPRVGGLGIVAVVLLCTLAIGSGNWLGIAPPGLRGFDLSVSESQASAVCLLALGLAILSLLDDRYGLPVALRFGAHFAAAIALLAVLADPGWSWLVLIALALAGVWTINLYNFMDGMDGLAGGMALWGFGALAVAGLAAGTDVPTLLAASIAGAALGFLLFNWHPARVFMGDCGSVMLGFLVFAIGLLGARHGSWPFWLPLWVFFPFFSDSSVTLIRRLSRGERVWQAHREHYYQRMVRMGWSHRKTALAFYMLMVVAAITGCVAVRLPPLPAAALAIAVVALHAALARVVDRRWSRFEPNKA